MYIVFCIFFSLFIASIPIFKHRKVLDSNKKYVILMFIILFLGSFIRLYNIENTISITNQDEASIGYEAYAILNYGVDRNGNSYPVHLVAWGSGQNILYAYIIMPFILILGNTVLTLRLPAALLGIITMLCLYLFCDKRLEKKNSLLMVFLFSIFPWHILKSRWGLESNIFPDLILIALLLFYSGVKDKNNGKFYLSSIIFGLSTYAYGTSYLFVPVLLIMMYIFLVKTKKITIKDSLWHLVITGIIALPMVLFVFINYFDLDSLNLGLITIPKLDFNRFTEITSVNGNIFTNTLANLGRSLKILVDGKDSHILNYIDNFGIFYSISLIFILIGLVHESRNIKKHSLSSGVVFSLLFSSIIIMIFVSPNINRINILWVALFYFWYSGVNYVIGKDKLLAYCIIILYLIEFILFSYTLLWEYPNNFLKLNKIKEVTQEANKHEYERLYIKDINYVNYLYYNEIDPNFYYKNRKIKDRHVMFQKVINIDNVYFTDFNSLDKKNVYIMNKNSLKKYDKTDFNIKCYDDLCVIYYK